MLILDARKGVLQMYSYKINNSYTIYVNYAYLNDCIKAGKEATARRRCKPTATSAFSGDVSDKIHIGSKIRLLDTDSGQSCVATILSSEELTYDANAISATSPVGRALIGHRIGDNVTIKIPAGIARYKILEL